MMNLEQILKYVDERLQKAGITTSSGGLSPVQVSQFIELTVNQSDFLKLLGDNVIKGIKSERRLDTISAQSRKLYKAEENVDIPASAIVDATFTQRTIAPVRAVLPVWISFDWLEENIEGQDVEDKLTRMFATAYSNDVVDLAWNGNTASQNNFLKITDGYIKLIQSDTNTRYFNRSGSTDWKNVVFPNLYKLLPDRYKADPVKLRFFVSYSVEQEYRDQLIVRETSFGDELITQRPKVYYQGIEVLPIPFIPYGVVVLTPITNLFVGFGSEMRVDRVVNPRAQRIEYYISNRIGFNYAVSDAIAYTV